MMELIFWRHAQAHEPRAGQDDLERALTSHGHKQAARMAAWLERKVPAGLRVVCSPARRTEQTAQALGRKYKLREELLPNGNPGDLLELVQWGGKKRGTVLVIGHQPLLGQTAAQLLNLTTPECAIRKGAVWWLRRREREQGAEVVLLAVQSPEFL